MNPALSPIAHKPLTAEVPERCARFYGAWGNGTWTSGRSVEIIVSSVRPDCSATVWQVTAREPGNTNNPVVHEHENIPIKDSFVLPGAGSTPAHDTFELQDGKLVGTARNQGGLVVSTTTPLEKFSP